MFSYNNTDYKVVTEIPAGARNIDIREISTTDHFIGKFFSTYKYTTYPKDCLLRIDFHNWGYKQSLMM